MMKGEVISQNLEVQDMIPCNAESSDVTTSDSSSSSMKSSDGYLPTTEPTSSSSDSDVVFSSDEDDLSSEDVEETIDFIRQKQGILKRAAGVLFDQEEIYDASTAKETSQMAEAETPPTSIWAQAKKLLPQKKAPPKRGNIKRSAIVNRRGEKKTVQPNPRDPTIMLGGVGHVDSGVYDDDESSQEAENDTPDGLPEVAFPQGQCMAQALIRSSSSFVSSKPSNPADCLWKVISDPLTCSLGLVPPPSISMEHGITIEDALAFSEEGRLLTQATPPFCVVYVNKAFMMLTGLVSKESVIGTPIESILQVTQDIMHTPKSNPDNDFIRARFRRSRALPVIPQDDSGDEDFVHCRMMIVPVMDRSRRRRLTPHARQAKRYSCMSHVLVRIRESDQAVSPSSSSTNLGLEDLLAVSDSDTRKDQDSASSTTSQESIRSNMVETIG